MRLKNWFSWYVPLETIEELLSLIEDSHSELQKLQVKIEQSEVEERLYRELLNPVEDLQYNYLGLPSQLMFEKIPRAFSENFKLGL